MKHDELIEALRRLKVETGSLACLGCGHEHNCSTQGCAILREAVEEQVKAPTSDLIKDSIHVLRKLQDAYLNYDAPDVPHQKAAFALIGAVEVAIAVMEGQIEEDGDDT